MLEQCKNICEMPEFDKKKWPFDICRRVPSGEKEAFTIFIFDVPDAENSGVTENGRSKKK